MKILFNNSIFYFQKDGGISRYFYSLSDEFIRNKYDLKIIAPINKNNLLRRVPKKNKISFYFKKYPSLKILELINNKVTDRLISNFKPDIFHETYYSNYKFKYKKSKKILTIYDLIHEKFNNYFSNEKILKKKETIYNFDHYICISQNTKKDLIDIYKIPEKKISVIYLAASHYRFTLNKHDNFKQKKDFFLYVGSRSTYKNFKLLISTLKKSNIISNYKIICFGGGKFSQTEKKEFKNLNIQHIDGNDEILIDLYKNAKCLILPSEYEGFGIPMLEAMELGCPVLSSSTPALQETGGDAALYFDPYSETELFNKLNLLINDISLANNLIQKGFERSNKFSWEKCATETLKVYKSIL